MERIVLLLAIFVASYFSRRFTVDTIIGVGYGYNILWFSFLYFIAGILRVSEFEYKRKYAVFAYLACILLIWANFYYTSDMFGYQLFVNTADYTSPLVLLASIAIFLSFKGIKFENKRINKAIRLFSSTTFGIYLLQEARFFKPHLYFDILKIQRYYSRPTSAFYILIMAGLIFILGAIFDLLRQLLFGCIEKTVSHYKNKK